jgi:hypothetical protein
MVFDKMLINGLQPSLTESKLWMLDACSFNRFTWSLFDRSSFPGGSFLLCFDVPS